MIPRIVFTLGDMNGIGAEVVLKTLATEKYVNLLHPILLGPEFIWKQTAKKYELKLNFSTYDFESPKKGEVSIFSVPSLEKVTYGKILAKAGALSMMQW